MGLWPQDGAAFVPRRTGPLVLGGEGKDGFDSGLLNLE